MMDWRTHEHAGLKVEADGHVAALAHQASTTSGWPVLLAWQARM